MLKGVDPNYKKKEERARQETFRNLAAEYLDKLEREGRTEQTMRKLHWLMDMANDAFGDMPIRTINAPMVLQALRVLENRGHYESARRMRSTIGGVFRYAVATARADNDPTVALRDALIRPKRTSRAAITDPKEFAGLLRAIDDFTGQPTTRAGLQLLAILFPRPGELRLAEWREFDFEKAVWTVPETRMKMRRPHKSPLPRQAIAILQGLRDTVSVGRLVFPGLRSMEVAMSDGSMNAALRRMGYAKEEVTPHGFRATAATLLNESGKWHPDAIERQLAHVEENEVRRAYTRGEHWEQRVEMMQWWADYLDTLKAPNIKAKSVGANRDPNGRDYIYLGN